MTHRRTLLFACLLAMTAGGAGAQAPADAPARKLATVETFSIFPDLVHNVGGDMVEVQPLVGPGGDAHVYVPSPLDARKLAAADVVFINGLRFTGWMDRLVASSGTKARIIMATKGIKPLEWNLPGAE